MIKLNEKFNELNQLNQPNQFGFILINKPKGPSSHNIVNQLRHITNIKRIGHAGTLDPLASGLMILGIGRPATKRLGEFLKADKEYEARLYLGKETDTYDATGKVTKRYDCKKLSLKEIRQAVSGFLGKQKQIPPMFSAKKVGGKKLYELARKNIVIERKASEIEIYKITILSYKWPLLSLRIYSSSGTYIRSIAYDLGRKLNCGAYLKALKRTKIGKYSLKKSHSIGKLKPNNWEKYLFLLK